jgi:hypothetical protein
VLLRGDWCSSARSINPVPTENSESGEKSGVLRVTSGYFPFVIGSRQSGFRVLSIVNKLSIRSFTFLTVSGLLGILWCGTKASRMGVKPTVFIQGLTSNHKEVLINPEQVLYVCAVGSKKSAVVLAHHPGRLILDQDPARVKELFDEFLRGFVDADRLN